MTTRNCFLGTAASICIAGLMTAVGIDWVAADAVIHKVGQVTWHPRKFVDRNVTLTGYVLARAEGYVLFSDEPKGSVSPHDLPVTGEGLDQLKPMKKYVIKGRFLDHGLTANNGSSYHLELSAPPQEAKQ